MRHETPLDAGLVDELMELWLPIFVEGIDLTREALLGEEMPDARITVYTRKIENRLAGACLVACSDSMPSLGGLGEVATSPAARRTGIASALTEQALDDFRNRGGQALFLGTVNPAAARIYHRLGWRKLAGARLMLHVTIGDSPEEFLVDYFRQIRNERCKRESADARGPRTADTTAGLAARLAGSGLQRGGDVHAVCRAGLMPGAVSQVCRDCGRRARRVVLRRH